MCMYICMYMCVPALPPFPTAGVYNRVPGEWAWGLLGLPLCVLGLCALAILPYTSYHPQSDRHQQQVWEGTQYDCVFLCTRLRKYCACECVSRDGMCVCVHAWEGNIAPSHTLFMQGDSMTCPKAKESTCLLCECVCVCVCEQCVCQVITRIFQYETALNATT